MLGWQALTRFGFSIFLCNYCVSDLNVFFVQFVSWGLSGVFMLSSLVGTLAMAHDASVSSRLRFCCIVCMLPSSLWRGPHRVPHGRPYRVPHSTSQGVPHSTPQGVPHSTP